MTVFHIEKNGQHLKTLLKHEIILLFDDKLYNDYMIGKKTFENCLMEFSKKWEVTIK